MLRADVAQAMELLQAFELRVIEQQGKTARS
jgi:hypothetical protein